VAKKKYRKEKKTGEGLFAPLLSGGSAGERTLVPQFFTGLVLLISLGLPNIIFSGLYWYDTLHIMKWVVALVPVGLLCLWGGIRMIRWYPEKLSFSLDPFGILWGVLLFYVTLQPLWVNFSSWPTFVKEWIFFASLFGLYAMIRQLPGNWWDRWLKWVLLLAGANASCNVIFAEIQKRGFPDIAPFIMNVKIYIGNTGQMNMFGLWCAIAVFGCIHLWISGAFRKSSGKASFWSWINALFLVISFWGLWNSASRSAILSLVVGLFFLGLGYWRGGLRPSRKILVGILLLGLIPMLLSFSYGRGASLAVKSLEVVTETKSIAGRDSIWATALTMISQHPLRGVGLGHFKWNYLESQKEMFRRFESMPFRYTYWAHNEIFQWFAETGFVGGMLFVAGILFWFFSFLAALRRKKPLPSWAIWANGLLCLFWFNALWTRPFHRIEDALWLAFAFALASAGGTFLPLSMPRLGKSTWAVRTFGAMLVLCSLGGIAFGIDGMIGDRLLARARISSSLRERVGLAERAQKHLMKRTEAEKFLADLQITLAGHTKNKDLFLQGLDKLARYFQKEPTASDLARLLEASNRLQSRPHIEIFSSYLKPGTYRYGPSEGPGASRESSSPNSGE